MLLFCPKCDAVKEIVGATATETYTCTEAGCGATLEVCCDLGSAAAFSQAFRRVFGGEA